MMCAKVGELCLCKFSIALAKIGHISELRLQGNGMDRWPEVWRIPGLQKLDVSGNRLESLPTEILKLSMLEELRISDNQLASLPAELATMPRLRLLDARNNRLKAKDIASPLSSIVQL
jgi:Leucine-rich repeat (LRR) protein